MTLFILTLIFSSLGLSAIVAGRLASVKNISLEELEQKLGSSGSLRKFFLETIVLPAVVFYKTKLRMLFYHFGDGAINKFRRLILKVEKNLYFFSRHLKKKKRALEMDLNNGSEFLKEMNHWKNGNESAILPKRSEGGTKNGTNGGTENNENVAEKAAPKTGRASPNEIGREENPPM
ncbi:MAG: hypothetical protein AAB926_01460 [Patescibacteria group bacterium]